MDIRTGGHPRACQRWGALKLAHYRPPHGVAFCCIALDLGQSATEQSLAGKLRRSADSCTKPVRRIRMHYPFDERVRARQGKLPPLASTLPPLRQRYHPLAVDEMVD